VFPGTPTPRAPTDRTEPPRGPFSNRPASLKPLFGRVSHAFQSSQPPPPPQLTDLRALAGDPNPIEHTFVARRTSGFLQTALSDLLRSSRTSLRPALLAEPGGPEVVERPSPPRARRPHAAFRCPFDSLFEVAPVQTSQIDKLGETGRTRFSTEITRFSR
jgi:hypothetical protein